MPRTNPLSPWGEKVTSWAYYLVPFCAFAAVFHEVFFYRATFTHDALFWYPNFNYFLNCLTQGELPLWDPYSYAGSPFYLNHTLVGTLDPLTFLLVPLVKYGKLDIFSAYQGCYLARFLIFYSGLHLLLFSLTRNRFASSVASGWGLFALGTCAFRQNGYFIMMTYVPIFFWATQSFLSMRWEKKKARALILIAAITGGLTFNLYLPLYFLVATTFFIALLLGQHGLRASIQRLAGLGPWFLTCTTFLFLLLAAPTLVILYDCFFRLGENVISLTRSEYLLESGRSLFSTHQIATPEWRGSASFFDLWVALLPGFYSPYFTFPPSQLFTEHFFTMPLLLTFALFQRNFTAGLFKSSPAVFIMFLVMGFLVFFRQPFLEFWIGHVPIVGKIRQFGNFFGYFAIFGSILFGKVLTSFLAPGISTRAMRPKALFLFATLMSFILVFFLILLRFLPEAFSQDFLALLPSAAVCLAVFVTLFYFYLKTRDSVYIVFIALLVCLNTVFFSISLKDRVTTPIGALGKTLFDQPRVSEFCPTRYPCLPRPYHFTGFTSALYQKPTLFYPYPNNYIFVSRKTLDALRFFSVDTLRSIHAFEAPILSLPLRAESKANLEQAFFEIATRAPRKISQTLIFAGNDQPDKALSNRLEANPLERTFYRPWDFFPDRESLSLQQLVRLEQSGRLIFSYSQLPRKNIFISLGTSADGLPLDPYYYGPGFFSQAAYIESSIMLREAGGVFYFGPNFPFSSLTPNQGPSVSPFQNSYNNKIDSLDLAKASFVLCSTHGGIPESNGIEVQSFGPNHLGATFKNPGSSWFYFADSYFPGWVAYCDGKMVPIVNANYLFKALFIKKPGVVRVFFVFEPQPYKLIFCIFIPLSIISFIALGLLGLRGPWGNLKWNPEKQTTQL